MRKPIFIYLFIIFFITACTFSEDNVQDKKRNYKKITLNKVSQFDTQGYIIRMWITNNYVFLSNAATKQIYQYSHDGEMLRKLGKQGVAPWENGTIWYFAVSSDQKHYYVQDYPKLLLKKYDIDTDSIVSYKKVIELRTNCVLMDNDKFVIPHEDDKGKDYKLGFYDYNNSKFDSYWSLKEHILNYSFDENPHLWYIFQGDFCRNSNGQVLHYCFESGVFLLISPDSKTIKVFNDFRNSPIPKSTVENGMIRLQPKQNVAFCAAMDNIHFYILITKDGSTKKFANPVLDVYSNTSGKYEYSIDLPLLDDEQRPMRIEIHKNNLWVLYENMTVVCYKFTTQ